MGIVLPNNVDRVSAQVLGFDANSYINNTKSTLNQRLNIPGAPYGSDVYAGKKSQKKTKDILAGAALTLASGAGIAILTYMGLHKGKLPKINFDTKALKSLPKQAFDTCRDFVVDNFKKITSKIPKKKS